MQIKFIIYIKVMTITLRLNIVIELKPATAILIVRLSAKLPKSG